MLNLIRSTPPGQGSVLYFTCWIHTTQQIAQYLALVFPALSCDHTLFRFGLSLDWGRGEGEKYLAIYCVCLISTWKSAQKQSHLFRHVQFVSQPNHQTTNSCLDTAIRKLSGLKYFGDW